MKNKFERKRNVVSKNKYYTESLFTKNFSGKGKTVLTEKNEKGPNCLQQSR